jgi:3-hydroxyisobutyrate dehydrogenase-like beta-hydroxyacid dehydrogenase
MENRMNTLTPDRAKVGLIGLGNMGSRLAARLLAHGYHVTVFNRDVSKAEDLATRGATVSPSVGELARTVDVILTSLTNDDAVRSVLNGPDGVFAAARPGTIVLETSTIAPQTSRELNAAGATKKIDVMDVAISGSTPAVESGSVTLLAGGSAETFAAATPVFEAIAKQFFLMGGPGSGTAMKLVVNTLLGDGMQAIAEAVLLGENSGLDRARLLEVLSKTAVVAPAHVGKLARMAVEDYSPQFPLRLMNKDFQLILSAAANAHISMPATEAAYRVNSDELKNGKEEDFSAVMLQMKEVLK